MYLFIAKLSADEKYHGILFNEAPLPGGQQPPSGKRLRSVGTDRRGFDSIAEALTTAQSDAAAAIEKGQPVTICHPLLELEGDDSTPHVLLFTNEELLPASGVN
jgi:hypothetical protein